MYENGKETEAKLRALHPGASYSFCCAIPMLAQKYVMVPDEIAERTRDVPSSDVIVLPIRKD